MIPHDRQFEPAYLRLDPQELRDRARRGLQLLASCRLCPRQCEVDRLNDETGFCNSGRQASVGGCFPHFGEEDPLRGWRGSGTIFFAWCNLQCPFCQNRDLSHEGDGEPVDAAKIAALMLHVQSLGCHNVNLVTPAHVVPQILEALPLAIDGGLRLPIVYNTGGYDSLEALGLLDGIVDIYMPDFKVWDSAAATQMGLPEDYPEVARRAIREMHRQVGDLVIDERGIALRGLLVRHLVMPNGLAGTGEVCRFLAEDVSRETYVNVMDQYRPVGLSSDYSGIGRSITVEEYREAVEGARAAGLDRLDDRRL